MVNGSSDMPYQVDYFLLPVCTAVRKEDVEIDERAEGSREYNPASFTIVQEDPDFGPAPRGYQWLKINGNADDENRGASFFVYRICIKGDYPAVPQAAGIKSGENNLTFCGGDFCLLVPGCRPAGGLLAAKTCTVENMGSRGVLHCKSVITNNGPNALEDVEYSDAITFESRNITLGIPVIGPSQPLSCTMEEGRITVFGKLGTINPGASESLDYDVSVESMEIPGIYKIKSEVMASSGNSVDFDMCTVTLQGLNYAVTNSCCETSGNMVSFTLGVFNGFQTVLNASTSLYVPEGVTISLMPENFSCSDFLVLSPKGAPLACDGTPIEGPLLLGVDFKGIEISSPCRYGYCGRVSLKFPILSTAEFHGTPEIVYTVEKVYPYSSNQIAVTGLSSRPSASVSVAGRLTCNSSCSRGSCSEGLTQ
jgi:hypothetical protein